MRAAGIPRHRVERHLQYESYILGDVVPLIRHLNPIPGIGVTGCSFGAYHAMAMALRHPYVFTSCITMSGAFDIGQFLDGWNHTDAYLLNPPAFLPGMGDAYYLDQYRRNKFVLATGEWDICRPATEDFSRHDGRQGPAPLPARVGLRIEARLAVLAADGQRVPAIDGPGPGRARASGALAADDQHVEPGVERHAQPVLAEDRPVGAVVEHAQQARDVGRAAGRRPRPG